VGDNVGMSRSQGEALMSVVGWVYFSVVRVPVYLVERLSEIARRDPAAAWGVERLRIYGAQLALVGLALAAAVVIVVYLAQGEGDGSTWPYRSPDLPPPSPDLTHMLSK
jgi:hypothetical protein